MKNLLSTKKSNAPVGRLIAQRRPCEKKKEFAWHETYKKPFFGEFSTDIFSTLSTAGNWLKLVTVTKAYIRCSKNSQSTQYTVFS